MHHGHKNDNLTATGPTASVLIPTWKRPNDLHRCLMAISKQSRRPDQVVITVRQDDRMTRAMLDSQRRAFKLPNLDVVIVDDGPLTSAMNCGLAFTTGDFVALTDDDSEPRVDWIERLLGYFEDSKIGGVGGRDTQALNPGQIYGPRAVGCISWYGRITANHHIGAGPPRDVDVLKGVNCCYRGELLRGTGFDRRLRGKANVSHWEVALCLSLRREGWRLIYDPSIVTDHHIAARHDGDNNARGGFERDSYIDAVHNQSLALLEYLPPCRRTAYQVWATLIGTSAVPGIAQVGRRWIAQRKCLDESLSRLTAARRGRALARLAKRPDGCSR